MWRAALERSEEKSLSWYRDLCCICDVSYGEFHIRVCVDDSTALNQVKSISRRHRQFHHLFHLTFIVCFYKSKWLTSNEWRQVFSSCYQAFYSSTSLKSSCRFLISDQHILIKLDSFNEAGLKTPFCNVLAC